MDDELLDQALQQREHANTFAVPVELEVELDQLLQFAAAWAI